MSRVTRCAPGSDVRDSPIVALPGCRHTAASLMFDAGLTIFDVQQRLGHHSPTVTAEVYTHLMRKRHAEGRRLIADYMGKTMAGGS